jgi:hypothetical protein
MQGVATLPQVATPRRVLAALAHPFLHHCQNPFYNCVVILTSPKGRKRISHLRSNPVRRIDYLFHLCYNVKMSPLCG